MIKGELLGMDRRRQLYGAKKKYAAAGGAFVGQAYGAAPQGLSLAPITVEDDVWIGSRVNIMAGVTVGRGSVIGAGAVVTHDVPPYSVCVGCPARVIKNRLKNNKE